MVSFEEIDRIIFLAETMQFSPHRVSLNSRDLLTSVNTILNALNLPMVDVPKAQQQQQQQTNRYEVQFKTVDIDKFYDFTKIPKISIKYEGTILILFVCQDWFRTWLASNVQAARVIAKRHQDLLHEIREKVNGIKDRFKFGSIEYKDDWSVAQFNACLSTLLTYADKWHERLSSLQGISSRLSDEYLIKSGLFFLILSFIFSDKTNFFFRSILQSSAFFVL